MSKLSKRWFLAEYFYSYFDRVYFTPNPETDSLRNLLIKIGVEGKKFNYFEWSLLRQTAKPGKRLFSDQFIKEERQKLSDFRVQVRRLM